MNGKTIVLGMLNPDSNYESNNRVYSSSGISPSVRARDYKDPPKILIEVEQMQKEVKQIGNLIDDGSWDNPQNGRIYSVDGICPTLNTCGGGGHEPKILEIKENGVDIHICM